MATVTITLEDRREDDKPALGVRIESDPGFPGPAAKDQTTTLAQDYGLMLMECLAQLIKGNHGQEILTPADPFVTVEGE